MQLYALTYTDPSEPWGHAVLDGKLYRTPSALIDAANAHFDAWCDESIQVWVNERSPSYDYQVRTGHYVNSVRRAEATKRVLRDHAEYGETRTVDEVLACEWSYEFGFARYQVVG